MSSKESLWYDHYGSFYFPQQATIKWQRVSQTVGGLPTDPTTKKPQLGMIGRVGEKWARSESLCCTSWSPIDLGAKEDSE